MNFPEKKISKLLRDIYKGTINPRNLPTDLYTATAKHLVSGAYEGFGFDLKTAKGKKLEKLIDIRENLYIFSGAKTYNQTSAMVSMLRDEKGEIKPFSRFKAETMSLYEDYNVNWLRSEYNTAIGQSQIVEQWVGIQENKDVLPLLKYSAIEDVNTSDICKPLDGIVLPVDHPFWRRFMPLNHFNCRCVVTQHTREEESVTRAKQLANLTKEPDKLITPLFETNVGVSAEIFNKSHPYFDVPNKDKAFARNNFNLPIPQKD